MTYPPPARAHGRFGKRNAEKRVDLDTVVKDEYITLHRSLGTVDEHVFVGPVGRRDVREEEEGDEADQHYDVTEQLTADYRPCSGNCH